MAQWYNSGLVTGRSRVRNQDDAQVPFSKALILVTKSLREELKPSVPWLLTYEHAYDLLAVR